MYKFKHEHELSGLKISVETQGNDLTSILETFESFLRAAGFQFDGTLEIISEEEEGEEVSDQDNLGTPPWTEDCVYDEHEDGSWDVAIMKES